jgi:hypothetical protein
MVPLLSLQAHGSTSPVQFIITTFHPQIVHHADCVFGVQHTDRVSRVSCIQQEQALAFLQVSKNARVCNMAMLCQACVGDGNACALRSGIIRPVAPVPSLKVAEEQEQQAARQQRGRQGLLAGADAEAVAAAPGASGARGGSAAKQAPKPAARRPRKEGNDITGMQMEE